MSLTDNCAVIGRLIVDTEPADASAVKGVITEK
jgi:hypothetical protein